MVICLFSGVMLLSVFVMIVCIFGEWYLMFVLMVYGWCFMFNMSLFVLLVVVGGCMVVVICMLGCSVSIFVMCLKVLWCRGFLFIRCCEILCRWFFSGLGVFLMCMWVI